MGGISMDEFFMGRGRKFSMKGVPIFSALFKKKIRN